MPDGSPREQIAKLSDRLYGDARKMTERANALKGNAKHWSHADIRDEYETLEEIHSTMQATLQELYMTIHSDLPKEQEE